MPSCTTYPLFSGLTPNLKDITDMTWRLARALETLRAEINAKWPHRSKVSDGTIGDAAHATRTSDYNPYIKDQSGVGVVRALDITNDAKNGPPLAQLIPMLLKDRRTRYVIFQRKIYNPAINGGAARDYSGVNARTIRCLKAVLSVGGGSAHFPIRPVSLQLVANRIGARCSGHIVAHAALHEIILLRMAKQDEG